jgi:hypothetical protein
MKSLIVLVALASLVACGKKDAPAASSGDAAVSGNAAAGASIPDDANSRAFAEQLVKTAVHNFSPADNTGMAFVYVTLTFRSDNTWVALSRLGDGDESVDCKETGTWTMEPATSASSAAMEWKLTETTCPGRPKNNIMRAMVSIEGGEYRISFR